MKPKSISAKSRLRMEIKEITAEGTFEGLLSPYGNVDGGNEVVEPGAYTRTLKHHGSKVPMLWQHKSDVPVGELSLDDRKDGLWCKGALLMELPEAQKAYLLIKAKIVKGLSIGFETLEDSVENGIRHLKQIRLYEGSIVTFPLNEMALITSVKNRGDTKGDFNEELEELQTLHGFYDMQQALGDALRSVVWSDLERDEKISAADTILQQFTDAFSAFFPNYIDILEELYGSMETWSAKRVELKERAIKAGAEFSAANMNKIKAACKLIKDGHDNLAALIEGEPGDDATSSTKSAAPKPDPGDSHSATKSLINEIRSLIH